MFYFVLAAVLIIIAFFAVSALLFFKLSAEADKAWKRLLEQYAEAERLAGEIITEAGSGAYDFGMLKELTAAKKLAVKSKKRPGNAVKAHRRLFDAVHGFYTIGFNQGTPKNEKIGGLIEETFRLEEKTEECLRVYNDASGKYNKAAGVLRRKGR